ncbi:MAG TPA: hypothetical protein VF541_15260 [Longimicrobium sp.]|jgi:hypothetical protein
MLGRTEDFLEMSEGDSLPGAPATRWELRQKSLNAAYTEAAADPDFIAELRGIVQAFDAALLDGLEEEPGA